MLIRLNPEDFKGTIAVLGWLLKVKLLPSATDAAEADQSEESPTAVYPSDPPNSGMWNANFCGVGVADAGVAVTSAEAPIPNVPSRAAVPTVASRDAVDLNARMEPLPF